MILWIDAQLPPAIAPWIREVFKIDATHVRELGLHEAKDTKIFAAGKQASAIILTKDSDFVDLVRQHGPPPHIVWLTCGNTTNARLRDILAVALPHATRMIEEGEPLVEIGEPWS